MDVPSYVPPQVSADESDGGDVEAAYAAAVGSPQKGAKEVDVEGADALSVDESMNNGSDSHEETLAAVETDEEGIEAREQARLHRIHSDDSAVSESDKLLERELLSYCANLRITNTSVFGGEANTHRVVTREVLDEISQVLLLLERTQQNEVGKKKLTAQTLLINSKYQILNTIFLPLVMALVEGQVAEATPADLRKLYTIFARIVQLPPSDWEWADVPARRVAFARNIQASKALFTRRVFWKGLASVVREARSVVSKNGVTAAEESELGLLATELEQLRTTPTVDSVGIPGRAVRMAEIIARQDDVQKDADARRRTAAAVLANSRSMIRALLRFGDKAEWFRYFKDAVSPAANDITWSTDFQLTVVTYLVEFHLYELFEHEWLVGHGGSTGVVQVRNFDQADENATLWRIIDFYCSLVIIVPPECVILTMLSVDKAGAATASRLSACTSSGPMTLSNTTWAVARHSRSNPLLAAKRVREAQSKFSVVSQKDAGTINRHRRRWRAMPPGISQFDFDDFQNTTPTAIADVRSQLTEKGCAALHAFMQRFVRLAWAHVSSAVMTDLNRRGLVLAGKAGFDSLKFLQLMSWILTWKRLEIAALAGSTPAGGASNTVKDEVIEDLLVLRCNLGDQGLKFVCDCFRKQVKHYKLMGISSRETRVILRPLLGQLKFGLTLALHCDTLLDKCKAVGHSILQSVFKFGVCHTLKWCATNVKPYSHDGVLIEGLCEALTLLLQAFEVLGGATAVMVEGRGKEDEGQTALRLRTLQRTQFVRDLADGRTVGNLLQILSCYLSNPPSLNLHVVRLLRLLVSPHQKRKQLIVWLFQWDYFELFCQLLHEESLQCRVDGEALIEFAAFVSEQFFVLFEKNKFLPVELFFPKNLSTGAGNPDSLSHPDVLLTTFTNYDQGRSHAAASAEGYTREDVWTLDESQRLVREWVSHCTDTNVLRIVKRRMRTNKRLRALQKQLENLRVIEVSEPDPATQNFRPDRTTEPLLEAVCRFRECNLVQRILRVPPPIQSPEGIEVSPQDQILRDLLCTLESLLVEANSIDNLGRDLHIPVPSIVSCDILLNGEYSHIMAQVGARHLDAIPSWEDFEPTEADRFYFPSTTPVDTLQRRVAKMKEYAALDLSELRKRCGDSMLPPQSQIAEQSRKCGVMASLAALSYLRGLGSEVLDREALKELLTIQLEGRAARHAVAQCRAVSVELPALPSSTVELMRHVFIDCPWQPQTEEELKVVRLAEDYAAIDAICAALVAGLRSIFSARVKQLLTYGSFVPNKILSVSRLTFSTERSNEEDVKTMKLFSEVDRPNPFVARVLAEVGFIYKPAAETFEPSSDATIISPWILPADYPLERINRTMNILRFYAPSSCSGLRVALSRYYLPMTSQKQQPSRDGETNTSSRSTAQKAAPKSLVHPYREIPVFSPQLIEILVDAVTKFRKTSLLSTRKAGIELLTYITDVLEKWATKRQQAAASNRHHADQAEAASTNDSDKLDEGDLKRVNLNVRLGAVSREGSDDEDEAEEDTMPLCENEAETSALKNARRCINQLRGAHTVHACITAMQGIPNNRVEPTTWTWSYGISCVAARTIAELTRLLLQADDTLYRRFRKGDLTLEKLKEAHEERLRLQKEELRQKIVDQLDAEQQTEARVQGEQRQEENRNDFMDAVVDEDCSGAAGTQIEKETDSAAAIGLCDHTRYRSSFEAATGEKDTREGGESVDSIDNSSIQSERLLQLLHAVKLIEAQDESIMERLLIRREDVMHAETALKAGRRRVRLVPSRISGAVVV